MELFHVLRLFGQKTQRWKIGLFQILFANVCGEKNM